MNRFSVFCFVFFLMTYRNNRHFQKPKIFSPFLGGSDRLKSLLPRYQGDHIPQIPIWVLSIRSLSIRRYNIKKTMGNNSFDFVYGLDIDEEFPLGELEMLFGGPRMWMAKRGDIFAKRKISIDYAHIRALFKLMASENEVAVILEDDAELAQGVDIQWELFRILKKVPIDWDIIYLTEEGNHVFSKTEAAKGIKIVRSTSATLAYMIHRKAALKVLIEILSEKAHLNIDLLYSELVKDGVLDAYLSLPAIFNRSNDVGGSTMDYEGSKRNPLYRMMMSTFG